MIRPSLQLSLEQELVPSKGGMGLEGSFPVGAAGKGKVLGGWA